MIRREHACGCVTTHDSPNNDHAFEQRCNEHRPWSTIRRELAIDDQLTT